MNVSGPEKCREESHESEETHAKLIYLLVCILPDVLFRKSQKGKPARDTGEIVSIIAAWQIPCLQRDGWMQANFVPSRQPPRYVQAFCLAVIVSQQTASSGFRLRRDDTAPSWRFSLLLQIEDDTFVHTAAHAHACFLLLQHSAGEYACHDSRSWVSSRRLNIPLLADVASQLFGRVRGHRSGNFTGTATAGHQPRMFVLRLSVSRCLVACAWDACLVGEYLEKEVLRAHVLAVVIRCDSY